MSLKDDIGFLVIGLAEYYDKELTIAQVDMYVQDLIDIPPADLLRAIRLYRNDSRNDRFPLPSKLRGTIQIPDDQRARDAVARILTAISTFGNYRNSEAKEFIGELGWEIVKLNGGWEETCRSISDDNKGIVLAQWRELGITLIAKHRLGLDDQKPALEFKSKGSLNSLGDILNTITKENNG